MAKFKNGNLKLKTSQKVILGNNNDHEIYWDGTAIVGATVQGLDQTGTDSGSFQIDKDNSGPKFVWNGFVLLARNSGDSDDIDFKCRDLSVSQDLLPTRFHRGVQVTGGLISAGGNLNPTAYLNVAVNDTNDDVTVITSFTTAGAAAGQLCFVRNELAVPITVVPGATIATPDGNNHTIWPSGSMLIQFRTNKWTVVGTKPDPLIDINNIDVTATIAIITTGHLGQLLTIDETGTSTIEVPSDASENLPIGFNVSVTQAGDGQVAFSGDGGSVVIRSLSGNVTISGQWGKATLTKIAGNEWLLDGDLSA